MYLNQNLNSNRKTDHLKANYTTEVLIHKMKDHLLKVYNKCDLLLSEY